MRLSGFFLKRQPSANVHIFFRDSDETFFFLETRNEKFSVPAFFWSLELFVDETQSVKKNQNFCFRGCSYIMMTTTMTIFENEFVLDETSFKKLGLNFHSRLFYRLKPPAKKVLQSSGQTSSGLFGWASETTKFKKFNEIFWKTWGTFSLNGCCHNVRLTLRT